MEKQFYDENRKKKIQKEQLRKNLREIILFFLVSGFNLFVFWLYELPLEPFLYGAVVLLVMLVIYGVFKSVREEKMAREREYILQSDYRSWSELGEPGSLLEEDYEVMIRILENKLSALTEDYEGRIQEMEDYYATWVHQIKTPIAVMKMNLGEEETEQRRLFEGELFRMEQYVDMVLQFIRLESDANDLVVKSYKLDDILREIIRKYAPQFIRKRIRLVYEGTDREIITDKKWYALCIEQLLSNAVKYTKGGSVEICVEEDRILIRDSGIGIKEEDIPLIFEKGYTGGNGRTNEKSSGIGLYLCKRTCDLLRVPIQIESKLGEGTTASIGIPFEQAVR